MVALVERDRTLAAAIYEPVTRHVLLAEQGGGAELVEDGRRRRLQVAEPAGLDVMQGSLSFRFIPDETIRKDVRAHADAVLPGRHYRRGCAAYATPMPAAAEWHLANSSKTMPWAHAPRPLITPPAD